MMHGQDERKTAFPPVAGADARVLILGSMPGEASLRRRQYYGHPRNAFWPILSTLLGIAPGADYEARCEALVANGIALWDVIAACARPGSLDQSIRSETIEVNDFGGFFAQTPLITHVAFNGATAATEYRRRVIPELPSTHQGIGLHRLPSTSPAHAGMRFEQKLEHWRLLLAWL
jgi:hypoxanthine-DNA glycosylase